MEWFTIPAFAQRKPDNLYHKEQEQGTVPACNAENIHVLCRSEFLWEGRQKLWLRISGDDYYKVYVNGRYAGQGPAPAYPEDYYYNEIDITSFLRKGRNIMAVHLYYQGLINRVWNSGDGRLALMAQLFLKGAGKEFTRPLFWKYKISHAYSGSVTGYDTQFLENFDSRKWQEDWNQPEFEDEDWEWMVPAQWADYSLSLQPTKPLAVWKRQPAGKEKIPGTEIWFVDAGKEITGNLLLAVEGRAGTQVKIRLGKELTDAGRVRFEMRCNCTYEEIWTLAEGVCHKIPFDYKAFRYGEIELPFGVRLLDVALEIRHYPMEEKLCVLKTENGLLNRIFSLCKYTVKIGTQEGYLDCPTREKGQYLGDALITSRAQVWLTGTVEMLRKAIRQFAQTAFICPGLMAVAPGSLMQEIGDFSLLWPELLFTDYEFTGDREFLKKYYPTARGLLDYFGRYAGEDGLLYQVKDKWNLVDWPENLRDGYDFPLTRPVVGPGCHNVINALYIGAVQTVEKIEKVLGLPVSRNWKVIKEAYIRAFYRPEEKLFADSVSSSHMAVHSNLYALYYGLAPEEGRERIGDYLAERGFSCGVMASYFLLRALAREERYEDVYRLLVNTGPQSWANMLRQGATTCYEAWGKEQKWNTSLCHPWASAPVSVIIEELGGMKLTPEADEGFGFRPHIPQDIRDFYLRVPLRGKIYEIKNNNIRRRRI